MAGADTIEKVVVLGIDGSEHSERAFHWYLDHAHREGQRLTLVHTVEPITVIGGWQLFQGVDKGITDSAMVSEVPSVDLYERMVDESRKKAKELEEKYASLMKEKGVSGKILALFGGKPGEVICDTAEKQHAVMIVMGTRGQGKLRRTVMGSVSDYVVHHAHCPVVVCRH